MIARSKSREKELDHKLEFEIFYERSPKSIKIRLKAVKFGAVEVCATQAGHAMTPIKLFFG